VTLVAALLGRWRWMALAALFACVVMVRLGIWQLDRLAARRQVNTQLEQRITAERVQLNALLNAGLPSGDALLELEYRPVVLRGYWDYSQQQPLTNQVWQGELGFHLVTPFLLEDSDKWVLVDRGWIPARVAAPSEWEQFREPQRSAVELVEIYGWIRLDQRGMVEIRRRVEAAGLPLLPLHVNQAPRREQPLPYKRVPVASIGEGVHAIAAAQWFIIGGIIVVGLLAYVRRETVRTASGAGMNARSAVR